MLFSSKGETCSTEAGGVLIAFDLSGSDAGYLLISLPEAGSEAADEFFGKNHHVELKDQLYGRYGGLSSLDILGDRGVRIGLTYEIPGIGNDFAITTSTPLAGPMLSCLQRLGASLR